MEDEYKFLNEKLKEILDKFMENKINKEQFYIDTISLYIDNYEYFDKKFQFYIKNELVLFIKDSLQNIFNYINYLKMQINKNENYILNESITYLLNIFTCRNHFKLNNNFFQKLFFDNSDMKSAIKYHEELAYTIYKKIQNIDFIVNNENAYSDINNIVNRIKNITHI